MTHITRPLLILAIQVIAVHGSAVIDKRQEEDPPLQKCEGGASATRSSCPQQSLSPATPKLAPRPRSLDHRRCCPPPPPACVDICPPRRVPPGLNGSTSSSSPPEIPQASSPPPSPSPPHGNIIANDQRSVEVTRKPSPEYDKLRATQYVSSSSLPPRVGGGGGKGTENNALLLPGSRSRSVRTSARSFPCRHHRRGGLGGGERPRHWLTGAEAAAEEAAAAVIMTCFVVGVVVCFVFLVWWRCSVCACK